MVVSVTFFVRVRERGFSSIWQGLFSNVTSESYDTIGGFLYLWLFILSVIFLKNLLGLVGILPPFRSDLWATANNPFASGYHPLLRTFLLFEIAGRTILLCGVVVVAEHFFKKHRRAPLLIIGFLLSYLVFLISEHLIANEIMKQFSKFLFGGWNPYYNKESISVLAVCLLWIPYFLRSKRVQGTFTH